MLKATKVRLYPTPEQELALAKSFGCARWYWNFALNACIQHYQETGKSLKLASYKGMLPQLKKEYPWLKENCYSSVLQCVAINLDRAYKNFFEGRAKFPNFKSKHHKQSIQYPQSVTVNGEYLKVPKIGEIKAIFHREVTGKIKTVTISKTSTDKYFASILCEVEGTDVKQSGDNIIGIDLGLKDFAITHNGENATKYANPKHLYRHQKNLARKQKKLSRKTKGSKSREKFRKIVAKVHEKITNSRQDFLHKLSRKLVNESQVIVVENLNVKGMVKNRKLSKAISDVGWGKFVNFIDYKLKQSNGELVEIDRFFPSSKTCSSCGHVLDGLSLDIREWDCPNCHTHHDRDENAALNIRNEGIRILTEGGGNLVFADGGCVRPPACKSKGHWSVNSEAYTALVGSV
ncbi:Putative transposase in snaA-snaB intergenic region [Planktothrix tepida]|uniref:Transposase n=1 Tax=Planktothrix tepida PCC 9214 TaxID=671072 RepID=A0A1J1LNZ8_9CYAN|nr:RNA-guided endonuclease TnpB family protein [Planktothrix tepida]CAD5980633.1 Putative transposase in snaA-snaB intergenic region [Planktothrix tepida]CUR33668.1 transposase [Planktothrix tepida PCC 9214]